MSQVNRLVLIVDDDPDICWALEHVLQGLGVRCIRALDGQSALQAVRLNRLTLALLDAKLPDIIEFARQYGRYGYRRITALLRAAGWTVNRKRVERIWRREGLKVPAKQPKRGRLWLNDGSCMPRMRSLAT